eukprot:TRINITY_DN26929_c0_g1_i1.p1 TRINITY_DN26929_c0_g1~~TRINITY_DN26929_c0_g1_i1.p1  ORF type:complete len:235 (-),score=35.09 TRINITY_DN26929_c0_g1_i1:60-764(-)
MCIRDRQNGCSRLWIPKAFPQQDLDSSPLAEDTSPSAYKPFSGLVHGTHCSPAQAILRSGKLDVSTVNDHSTYNGEECLWMAPNCSTDSSYGAVVFNFDLSLVKNKYFYWVEVVDYKRSQAASRVVVSYFELEDQQHRRFDPAHRGGPLWVDRHGLHYALQNSRRPAGGTFNHSLEFVFLDPIPLQECVEISILDQHPEQKQSYDCLLYTSDAADEEDSVDLGGRRYIKKKNHI